MRACACGDCQARYYVEHGNSCTYGGRPLGEEEA